ncbi:MAG: glycosyl transferase, partial [Rhodospirillaceae bacterium]|nr:glycosyl transferase [Rhodospirillaceae bacterium]
MSWLALFAIFIITSFASAILTGALRQLLLKWNIFDHPNERSSHKTPTPRGGGLAVMIVVLGAWVLSPLAINEMPAIDLVVFGTVAAITLIFWFEDLKGLPLLVRLGAQGVATLFLLLHMGAGFTDSSFLIFQGLLPPAIDIILTWGLWIWFINLFNFMDGIDAISVAEAVVIAIGATIIGVIGVNVEMIVIPALAVAGAMAGFFIWNRPPAKIFLGDVGSVSLGLLLGWVLLQLAANGLWAAALILPLYYFSDATITLLKR